MKHTLFLLIAFIGFSQFALAQNDNASIAQVDRNKIKDLLEQIVLSKPENAELSKSFKAYNDKILASQKKMQEAILKGEKINPMSQAMDMLGNRAESKQVELLTQKYLLACLKKLFGKKYTLILSTSGYKDSVLLTNMPIDDVTDLVKQALLEELPTKKK